MPGGGKVSERREIEARLALYDDLSGILRAMRSFALAELHRVMRREKAQNEVVQTLSAAFAEMAPAAPKSPRCAGDVWLLFGSVRGFCASFNDDVLRAWQGAAEAKSPVVVVGERLAASMDGDGTGRFFVPGPIGALDAAAAVDRILLAFGEARRLVPGEAGLVACFRDDAGARNERLLPLALPLASNRAYLPLTQEPARQVAEQVMQHYLFHALLARLLNAIRVENHMRLAQMENALRHLDRSSENLQRQDNRLRQEEIVEEIELILQDRAGV
jgi:F-type H+-transporting ATPase subunit gamma